MEIKTRSNQTLSALPFLLIPALLFTSPIAAQPLMDQVEHNYVDNDGVSIHYAKMGSGPLIVFIHGFPDFWYSWRHQMIGLADEYAVAALDTRGYNLSGKPEGEANYDMALLTSDVAAVIAAENEKSAIIVGHDWGGGIAWSFAAAYPQMTDRLIIMNLPHIKGLQRELSTMGQQHSNSQYARNFQQPDSHENVSPAGLAIWLSRGDEALRKIYLAAFENSSTDSMMNYYRRNYPREPYTEGPWSELPRIQAPVLQFHGLDDTALLAPALNNTWEELDQDWTLVTIPGVGHWPH
ncbi:MAG: alpha/beta hydrolase, partial [Gammaproteobacteria bacterium]|nr:alpha/beta hydrolase [Gammaproteobacteria bacterium]